MRGNYFYSTFLIVGAYASTSVCNAQVRFVPEPMEGWSNIDPNYPVYHDPSAFYRNGEMICHDGRSLGIQSDSRNMGPDLWSNFDESRVSSIRPAARCWRIPGRCEGGRIDSGSFESLLDCSFRQAVDYSHRTMENRFVRGSILNGTNLSSSWINGSSFEGTYFMSTNLSSTHFENSILWGTRFHNVLAVGMEMRNSWVAFDSGFFSSATSRDGMAESSSVTGGNFRDAIFENNRALHLRFNGVEASGLQILNPGHGVEAASHTFNLRESHTNHLNLRGTFSYIGIINSGLNRQEATIRDPYELNGMYLDVDSEMLNVQCADQVVLGVGKGPSIYNNRGTRLTNASLRLSSCANRNSGAMGSFGATNGIAFQASLGNSWFPAGSIIQAKRSLLYADGFMPFMSFASTDLEKPELISRWVPVGGSYYARRLSNISGSHPFFQAPRIRGAETGRAGTQYAAPVYLSGDLSYSQFKEPIVDMVSYNGNFTEARFANPGGVEIRKVEFNLASFTNAVFVKANISETKFPGANFQGAWLVDSTISGSSSFDASTQLSGLILAGNSRLPISNSEMAARGVRRCLQYHTEVETLPQQMSFRDWSGPVTVTVPEALRTRTKYVCDRF